MSAATAIAPANPLQMTASNGGGGGTYELCPQGNHAGYLVCIYVLGTHDGEYKGKPKQTLQVYLAWELPDERKPDGTPHVLARIYSLSFTEKSNLRLMFEQWRGSKFADGEAFDISKALGKPCLVNVTHKPGKENKSYHEVGAISALPKGMQVQPRVNDLVLYTLDMGSPPKLEWLPYSYGEHPADIVDRCNERTGRAVTSAPAPAAAEPMDADDPDNPF